MQLYWHKDEQNLYDRPTLLSHHPVFSSSSLLHPHKGVMPQQMVKHRFKYTLSCPYTPVQLLLPMRKT